MLVQPDEVGDPVGVRVAGDEDVVADVVVVERLQRAVAVRLVAVPGVVVERVGVAVGDGLVDAREDRLAADDAPGGAAGLGLHEGVVEPVFLARAHHAAAGVVGEFVHVVRVPVQVCDAAVVLARVEHDEVEKVANLEVAPDTEIVVHINLSVEEVNILRGSCLKGKRTGEASIRSKHALRSSSSDLLRFLHH